MRFRISLSSSLLIFAVLLSLVGCNVPTGTVPLGTTVPPPPTQTSVAPTPLASEPPSEPTPMLTPETVVPTPAEQAIHKSGLECVGAAVNAGQPPTDPKDLLIQVNVPSKNAAEAITFFKSFARPCDGIGVLGRFVTPDWRETIGDLSQGLVFYSLPSLELALQTADSWTTKADWFAYELVMRENTPASESSDPGESSRRAMEFAHAHNLAYMATPGRPVTLRYAADMAKYADAYGMQAYGESRESPESFLQFVKDTSSKIRAVKPDILFFVAFSTDQAGDDAQASFDLIQQTLGYIDGVFLRTDGSSESMERWKTLIEMLR